MKYLKPVLALVVLLAGTAGAARAADLSRAVMLAASEQLAGTPYEEHAPSHKVVDAVYVGGPVFLQP